MSWDDDLRKGLGDAADLLPLNETAALDAAKVRGRKGVRKRRVLVAGGSVFTASALLVGALSLAQDQPSATVVADETQVRTTACDGAYPTVAAGSGVEVVDERTFALDGHTIEMTDRHVLNGAVSVRTEFRLIWYPFGDLEREVTRQFYIGRTDSEVGFAGNHLPRGCTVVARTDAGFSENGQEVLMAFEAQLVWPASAEPEPIIVTEPTPVCGVVAPFQSKELDIRYGPPEITTGADGRLSMSWADADSSVEVHHPAPPDAVAVLPVLSDQDTDPSCDLAELVTGGTVSVDEATSMLRPVDPDLVDSMVRQGINVATSSATEINPATLDDPTTTTTVTPEPGADTGS